MREIFFYSNSPFKAWKKNLRIPPLKRAEERIYSPFEELALSEAKGSRGMLIGQIHIPPSPLPRGSSLCEP